MKFIYADSIDQIDPDFDFARDRHAPGRRPYWSDQYAHEFMPKPPYDGVLVSRGIVGDHLHKGKYSDAQAIRFRRVGARRFLRMDTPALNAMPIFGDCGAFTYVKEKRPPYTAENMAQFYAEGRFTHGCSVDHIIFAFRPDAKGLEGAAGDDRERFDITLENASAFLKASKTILRFKPMGAIQGWSPESMAYAAKRLERMGYDYLAVGGMAPLVAPDIKRALQAIRSQIKPSTKLHILGFAKAEQIHQFTDLGIESFDSTSPLYRAFMDAKSNYYAHSPTGGLDYYTAIRIPLATDDRILTNAVMEGRIRQELVTGLESRALGALRAFDQQKLNLESTVEQVMAYQSVYQRLKCKTDKLFEKTISATESSVRHTLQAAPWKVCGCKVCREAGIEAVIFRSSNRNKRRGFHNLQTYSEHLANVLNPNDASQRTEHEKDHAALRRA